MMTKLLALLCALAVVGGYAHAADLPVPAAVPVYAPPIVPVYNWTGSYVGINGGWGWGTAKWTVAPIPATPLAAGLSNSISDNGGVVGGTLGFNWQIAGFGGFVFGGEGDWDYSAINTGTTAAICNFSGNCQTGNNWLATVRGRAGYAWDRILFYGTAGGAFANVQTVFNGATMSHSQAGWTAGAGVEWAFAENWSAKLEYLYINLGNDTTVRDRFAERNPPQRRADGKSPARRRQL
jgi:outer membrane immunogenic protein